MTASIKETAMASTSPHRRECLFAATVVLATIACGTATGAQRTFVASNGNDVNACSLTAPCRGFARAITQTADKGEIIVLDSAGYGTVTIDKSVSIIAPPGVYAGISVFTGNGITIATSGVKVLLRGLNINGQGGNYGIYFTAGGNAELVVEQCAVANMAATGVFAASAGGRIIVRDTVVRRNADGIFVSLVTHATIDRSRIESNALVGIRFDDGAWGTISDSAVSGNAQFGVLANSATVQMLQVSIDRSVIVENGLDGINAIAAAASEVRMAVTRSTIARNSGDGVQINAVTGAQAFGEVSDNEITGNGGAGIHTDNDPISISFVSAVGNRVTRNLYGFSNINDADLKSLGNNLIRNNLVGNVGTMTVTSGF